MEIKINTKEGTNQITTEKLKGELKGVVLSFINNQRVSKVRILIESELGYTLFDYPDLVEPIYIPLSIQKIDKYSHLTSEWTNYYLDEKLKITVSGAKNQEVQIILRIDKVYPK